jgi:hypothetical protein
MLPIGVTPEAIVEKNSGIESKILALYLIFPLHNLHKNSFPSSFLPSGARPALPMGLAPEAMVGFFGGDHRLKVFFDLHSCD